MIPPFNTSGWLPPGVHTATLDEVSQRFGSSPEIRRVQMESIRWMINLAKRAAVRRIVLNGSFVTDIIEPNDVDCVLLGAQDPVDLEAEAELQQGLPFLDMFLADQDEFDFFIDRFFAFDRSLTAKGMIEVVI